MTHHVMLCENFEAELLLKSKLAHTVSSTLNFEAELLLKSKLAHTTSVDKPIPLSSTAAPLTVTQSIVNSNSSEPNEKTSATTTATIATTATVVAKATIFDYSLLPAINTSNDNKVGIAHGHHSAQGMRPSMEDDVCMWDAINLKPDKLNGITSPISFYGVFDGHGGKKAAEYTKHHLVRLLVDNLEKGMEVEIALKTAFIKTDTDYIANCGTDTSGCTAVTLLIEHSTGKYWCSNVGDSRCLLSRKNAALPLSVDHKADRPDEMERIRKAGGFVIHKRVLGELAVSRAIGDKDFKHCDALNLIIAEPEFKSGQFNSQTDDFFVLACDGLYDVMSNDDIVSFIHKSIITSKVINLDTICTKIVTWSIEELHTRDNVSAIVVKIN